mgnify:CR=1 FL=1
MVAYVFLPVSAVPNVDFPMIRVSATRPGADPSVMAATVAAPLERRLGQIAGIDQITSTSSLGNTNIQLTFAIGRDIDRGGPRDHGGGRVLRHFSGRFGNCCGLGHTHALLW